MAGGNGSQGRQGALGYDVDVAGPQIAMNHTLNMGSGQRPGQGERPLAQPRRGQRPVLRQKRAE